MTVLAVNLCVISKNSVHNYNKNSFNQLINFNIPKIFLSKVFFTRIIKISFLLQNIS